MVNNLSSITLKEVHSRADLRRFVDFPREIYRGHPNWVPALRSDDLITLWRDKNPAFEFCEARYWLAVKGNETVGRIAGIINHRAIEKWEKPYARFGWVDFIDDAAVVKALLGAVESWAAEKGLKAVHGPLGFTDLDREGMLVEGFDKMGTLATIYNYPYYPRYMEAAGYRKNIDWVEYLITVPENGVERIDKLAEVVRRRYNLSYLEVRRKKDLLRYAGQMFDLLDETYAHLYGTTFLTKDQKEAYTKQYFGFISPDFVPCVLDEDGRMIGFGIAMPSLSLALQRSRGRIFPFGFIHLLRALRKNDRGDLYLIGVRPEFQGKGVTAMLISRIIRNLNKHSIRIVESNPELENNLPVQAQWKHFEHHQHKRRRVYIKKLKE